MEPLVTPPPGPRPLPAPSLLVGAVLAASAAAAGSVFLAVAGDERRWVGLGIGLLSIAGIALLTTVMVLARYRGRQFFDALADRPGVFWVQSFFLAALIAIAVLYNQSDW